MKGRSRGNTEEQQLDYTTILLPQSCKKEEENEAILLVTMVWETFQTCCNSLQLDKSERNRTRIEKKSRTV